MGQARTILFFSTWLQVDPLDLSPAHLSGRMREWADLLVTDLHQADNNPLPTAPVDITVEQAHALSLPGPPKYFRGPGHYTSYNLPFGTRSTLVGRRSRGFL